MPNNVKILLIPASLVVLFCFLDPLFGGDEFFAYFTFSIESLMAVLVGYVAVLWNSRIALGQCALLAAMIGVMRLLVTFPSIALWDAADPNYATAIGGFVLVSIVGIGFYSMLGAFGGKLRRLINKGPASD